MSPVAQVYLQTVAVAGLAVLGVAAGRRCSRLRKPWWLVGYLLPLLFILTVGLARRFPQLELRPPFAWLMAGRTEFALLAFICTLLLTTPLSRLSHRRQRIMVLVLMVVAVGYSSILPFLCPAFNYRYLLGLETTLDADGVCLQSNDYTCGPAAAVTGLRRLGIEAHEGRLAVHSHTTRITGTPPDSLCLAIQECYGVPCRLACMRRVDEIRGKEPFIAVVKYAFLVDHYVTVLEVGDSEVTVGDPLAGKVGLSHEELARKWRRCGILIEMPAQDRLEF